MRVFDFHGGVHPPENKKQSTRAPIGQVPIAQRLIIPTQQHLGLAAEPVVNKGQKVAKGELIASPVGRISSALHAPSSGTIIDIAELPVPHASGLSAQCIVIETDGEDRWIDHQGLDDYTQLDPADLIKYMRDMGIAGMGGAGFPTDAKLNLGHDHIVNTLIVNAAECEPYITADDTLMREYADDIIAGIQISQFLLKPSHTLIGIEDNKPNAIKALNVALAKSKADIDLVVVPTKYPSGGERQLIQLLTDIEVPSGKIPADVGIVMQNVGTLQAMHRAVAYGEPMIKRVVTVTGDAVKHPMNVWALLGTPFDHLLKVADLDRSKLSRLIMGGPMMGMAVDDLQIPVIKTTNCLIAATTEEMPESPPAQPCIRCGMCEQVCPAQLLPQQLFWFAKGKEFEKAENHNLFDCIECGACAYVCPSSIPLVQYYRFAKSEIRAERLEQRKADHARKRFEDRQHRLEREAIEKAERRKARAAEAAKVQAERKKNPSSAPSVSQSLKSDPKSLKIAAAMARTKLKKAELALKNARDKKLDGADALEATVIQLKQAANDADIALNNAEKASGDHMPQADLKSLKQNVSIMRTKLKKAKAGEADESTIKDLETRLKEATEQHQSADNQLIQQALNQGIDLKQLRIDLAMAKANVTKLERAMSRSEESEQEYLLEELSTAKAQLNELETMIKPYA